MTQEQPWATVESGYAYRAQTPDEISFRTDLVRFPSGREGSYVYAEYPFEVCFTLPVMDDGRLLLIRQYRYPIGKEIIQLPAGSPLPNESLADCAIRETEEETGMRPTSVTHLLDFYPSPGSADMKGHLFIARGLVESTAPRDPDEPAEPFVVEHDQAIELVRQGQIQEAATVIAILALDRPALIPKA